MREASRKMNMRDKPRKHKAAWKRVVSAMAVIVVFCTVYALVLPAITLSEDPICGQQAHEHTEACYRTEIRVPACSAAMHVHDESCAGTLENPACGFGERVLHTHDGRCYDQTGELICQLPELQEHIHGEECGNTEQKLICTAEEVPGHTHGESCYQSETVLICQESEKLPHTHGDECYQLAEEPTCQQEHEHTQECYERLLICTQEETEGHTHGDSCYELRDILLCTEAEHDGHMHGEECHETVTNVTCEKEQVADHQHTPSCFNEAGERICGLISGVVHVHDDTCFKVIHLDEPELICSIPEHIHVDACFLDASDLPPVQKDVYCEMGEHEHVETCYDAEGNLICTIPVHVHEVSCKVPDYDPEADLETPEDWEAAFKDLSLTGRWPEDLLSVAVTQLGYRESKQNVIWHEDGSVKGYTRYGAWYGAPYVDWSAAFVSFCVEYANISGLPQDSSCESYRSALETMGLLREPMNYLPKPGDLVLFDINTDDDEIKANRMGIVSEMMLSDAGELTTVKVLVGDADGEVKYLTYDLLSSMILCYAETPAGESKVLLCEEDHTHTDDCYGYKLFYSDDILYGEVLVRGVDALPANLTLHIERITAASDPADYGSMIAALSNQMQDSPYYMGDASFYQMQLFLEGEPYELPEGANTAVEVAFRAPVFTAEAMDSAAKVETFLLTQDDEIQTQRLSGAVSARRVQARSASQVAVTGENGTVEPMEVPDTYNVERVEEDTYENASGGLTGVGFESDTLDTFAVVLSSPKKTGQFWERIFSLNDLVSGETYVIVSAEGNFALLGENANNHSAVMIHAQKGEENPDADWEANAERNTKYYTITKRNGDAIDNNYYWTITKSGNNYTIRNQGTSNYVYLGTTGSYWNRQSHTIYTSSANLTLSYKTPENVFRIANGNNYLRNTGDGAYEFGTGNDGQYNSNAVYYNSRDMLIFKLSDVTSLEIPDDVVEITGGSMGSNTAPDKPDYGEFIVPSDSKTGQTAVTEGNITVKGEYFSDPSTSDIETGFRQDSYEASEVIDGKVVTDKSVIYGADDYAAFNQYDPNTFSVTLSTLGQEYKIPYQYLVKTPVDVVFILDVSGSMSSTQAEGGTNPDRVIDLRNAVNKAMASIFADHEANRVGISVYSSGAWQMLPLDRYTANNNEYLVTNSKNYSHSPSNLSLNINFLQGAPTLKSESGTSYAGVGSDWNQGVGTYTQAGIAMGNEIFEAIGDDTTYTTTLGEGEYARPYTVTRQPVFILVSDGEPTHSTSIYNDVLKGPHYGNGRSGSTNGKGVHGYYTVLSANYYKRAVSIQYQIPALFYSIGMGIHATEDGPLTESSDTGDNYKRAVLNPQKDIIENLTADKAKEITVDQLKGMLLNTYSDATVEIKQSFPDNWYGIPHAIEPVLQPNPYTNNYSYTDGAYFGDLPEEELSKIFEEIYQSSVTVSPYGFVLYKNSSVNIVDNIGSGMEIKGTPVLRYNGVNYTNPKISTYEDSVVYVYEATVEDPYIPGRKINLSEITVMVSKAANGDQSLYMYVPDTALPTYTPELIGQKFYYEQLPVRLIYQVGLTEEAEAQVLDLNTKGGEMVFYTSKWDDENVSTSTLLPSEANPFYYHIDGTEAPYKPHHNNKTQNTTDTVDYHVDCHRDIEVVGDDVLVEVLHKQGNNGKLVFKAETVDVPIEKKWDNGINADIMNPVEAVVYKVNEMVDDEGAIIRNAEPIQTVTLSAANQWSAVVTGLQQTDGTWYYAMAETPVAGYSVTYDRETIRITTDGGDTFFDAVVLENDGTAITMTNSVAVQLPSTGGGGTFLYTLGGLLLMAAAILWYSYDCKRRREERTTL